MGKRPGHGFLATDWMCPCPAPAGWLTVVRIITFYNNLHVTNNTNHSGLAKQIHTLILQNKVSKVFVEILNDFCFINFFIQLSHIRWRCWVVSSLIFEK